MENESRNPLPGAHPNPGAVVAADVGNSWLSSPRRSGLAEWPTIDGPLGLSHDESLTYARRFFKWGFFCLPFLWGLNCFYFWPILRRPYSRHWDPLLRRYLVGSAIGFLVFTAILTSWALTFAIGGNGASQKKFTCSKFHWKPEEDVLLASLVQKFGPSNWELIAKQFRGRTGKSCRLRWVNQLDPVIVKKPFTVEEKRKLLELHQYYGNKWAVISKHFDGRTDNQVKNQYHVLVGSRIIRTSSPPSGDHPEDTPKEESMNLSHFENASAMASGSQVSNFSYNKDNSSFDPFSDVTPYRVEVPFIDNGTSVYGKDEMWFAASGSNPGMIDPHSFDNANLGYIGSDQSTIWDDEMNSDVSYTELLNLPSLTPPQQGCVKDPQFIDFLGLEQP